MLLFLKKSCLHGRFVNALFVLKAEPAEGWDTPGGPAGILKILTRNSSDTLHKKY